nr:venom peptide [Acharia stimulea]
MKVALLLVALAALFADTSCAVVPSTDSNSLSIGTINPGDQIMTTLQLQQAPADSAFSIKNQEITYTFGGSIKITAIRSSQVTSNPTAEVKILSGGIGTNTITVRAQETNGSGFDFQVEIWGHY